MIKTKNDLIEWKKLDRIALGYNARLTIKQKLKLFIWPDWIYRFEVALRNLEYLQNSRSKSFIWWIKYFMAKLRHRRLSLKLGFSIGPNIFGPGLSIPHYGSIVVNPNVRVGANCRLHVGVSIGANGGPDKVPRIGNNVYIGPGAILFGDIVIADNVSIGANSTVTNSFLDSNVIIAGSPARVIRVKDQTKSE